MDSTITCKLHDMPIMCYNIILVRVGLVYDRGKAESQGNCSPSTL